MRILAQHAGFQKLDKGFFERFGGVNGTGKLSLTGETRPPLRKLARGAGGRIYAIDATYIRVHQAAANAAGDLAQEAIGLSRGGLTTKIHALVDGTGRAISTDSQSWQHC